VGNEPVMASRGADLTPEHFVHLDPDGRRFRRPDFDVTVFDKAAKEQKPQGSLL
jgi:hypothetical protein